MSQATSISNTPSIGTASVNISDVGPVPWAEYSACPMPLVMPSGFTPATTAPVMPSMPLVETPHDQSVRAIEVPNGATVLVDGTVVTGGVGFGTGSIGSFVSPDPPRPLDLSVPMFQAPVLSGQ